MKLSTYITTAVTIAACTIVACKKEKVSESVPPYTPAGTNITKDLRNKPLDEVQDALDGKWYLLARGGGFTGDQHVEYSGIYYIFGKDVFTISDNGKITETPIKWARTRSIHNGDSVYGLQGHIGSEIISPIFISIKNDSLYASDNAYDGYGYSYIKIK